MNQQQFDESTKRMIGLCMDVMRSKGAAYTIGSEDRLANFKRVSAAVGITPLQVWATFFEKQVSAVMHFVNNPASPQSEPIESRIVDIVSYAFLGWGLIQETPATGDEVDMNSSCDCEEVVWPEMGDDYYYISDDGTVWADTWEDCDIDQGRRDFAGIFRHEETAEEQLAAIKKAIK